MKILFYGAKDYDQQFFDKLAPEYPGITFKFIEANLYEETASLAKGYDGICAFVNADISTAVVKELHIQGVRLILMRCAGYNNVDLKAAAHYGIKVLRVPGYSPELLPNTLWHLFSLPTATPTRLILNAAKITLP